MAPVATVTLADRRARLARRHHLGAAGRAASVEDVAGALVGLHATDLATVYLSLWARVEDVRRADVERALYDDRSLVKVLAMRRTLFVVPRQLLGAVVHGGATRTAATTARELVRDVEQAGLHDDGRAWLEASAAAVASRLDDGAELTLDELRRDVPSLLGTTRIGEGRSWARDWPVGPRVLAVLSARGELARGRNAGSWMAAIPTWAAMARWLGAPLDAVDPAEGRAELVRAWLRSFGPGSLADLAWWLGDTQAHVRAALAAVGAVEVAVEGASAPGYVLADDLEPVAPVAPWAALLPALDPTTMGWKERGWYVGDHAGELFDRAGNGGTTAWWDGRVVGAWHQLDGPEVRIHLLEDIGAEGTVALDRGGRAADGVARRRAPRRPLAVAGADPAAEALSAQSSNGRGVNSADAGDAPAMASAASTTAAEV